MSWLEALGFGKSTPLAEARFVVIDTETSGLRIGHDRLLSIGVCEVRGGRIPMSTSFHRTLRQDQASEDANILVHGIGRGAQLEGDDPAQVLRDFLAFAGDDPLVAYSAPFDAAFLGAAVRERLGQRYRPSWFDLARLTPALFPKDARKARTLDDWLARFGIVALERHDALEDAYCTAQLLLAVLAKAPVEGFADLRGLRRAERLA